MGTIKEANDANFEQLVLRTTAVVVDWATWCGPCKMVAPEMSSPLGTTASTW
jgi:thiol-disulfide isomerase/thioredoxin